MTDINELIQEVIEFRDAREWKQFHNPKDLAVSLSIEAAELLERFQWKSSEEALDEQREGIEEELADVLLYALIMAHDLEIDLLEALRSKIAQNSEKYPVDKARGRRAKYTEL